MNVSKLFIVSLKDQMMVSNKTKDKRIIIALLLLIVICLPVFIYITHIKYLGFPDGHLTELDRAEKLLFNIFVIVSILFLLFSFYFGIIRMKIKSLFSFLRLFFFYICLLVIFYGIIFYLSTFLKNGAGG